MSREGPPLDVSRETFKRLEGFVSLVEKWNPAINLVAKNSLANIWTRHIADSAQLYEVADPLGHVKWADLGSGGGFPGVVIAILAAERDPDLHVCMVESDARKATFLRRALSEVGVGGEVRTTRIEEIAPLGATVLSARALAPLSRLLAFADRHLASDGHAVFPKGVTWEKEVEEARREWIFDLETVISKTDPQAAILKVKGISRV